MSIMNLFTEALIILMETIEASSWFRSRYFNSLPLKIIFESSSNLRHFSIIAQAYDLRLEVLSPPEVDLPMMISICFLTRPRD